MKKLAALGFAIALLSAAAPVVAGTLYLPVVNLGQPEDGAFKTRVWITNNGSSPAKVKLLYMPGFGDGTTGRGTPETRTVAPGATLVLFESAGPGLLEIQAPDAVAVAAELRNTLLPGPQEVFGAVPAVGSDNLRAAGEVLVLQGLRRSKAGVRSHLGLLNLGHKTAACSVSLHSVVGDELVGATGLPLAPLSHVLFEDVLELAEVEQIGDVHARISCDRPYSAYAAVQEAPTGEIVFLRPSVTGASKLVPPTEAEEPPPPPPPPAGKSYVFTRSGNFHTPTKNAPSKYFNIPAPKNKQFRKVILEMDITPGAWNGKNPAGNHSLFWLHRGACCWPQWRENIVGFVNAFGPNKSFVRATHNVDYKGKTKYDTTQVINRRFSLAPGKTYRVRYVYDAAGGTIRLTLSRQGKVALDMSGKATATRIRSGGTGMFMAHFGHAPHRAGCNNCGPEVPTYGWKYANLRVEFIE